MISIYLIKDQLKDLTEAETAVYIALRYIKNRNEQNLYYITPDMIAYYLTCHVGKQSLSRKYKEKITEGLFSLCDKLSLDILESTESNRLSIDLSNIGFDFKKDNTQWFSIIPLEYVQKIMTMETSIDRLKLLRYFACLVGTFNNTKKNSELKNSKKRCGDGLVGDMAMSFLCSISGYCEESIRRYHEVLEQAEILYIYRSNFMKPDANTGKITTYNNCYGLYCNKADVIAYAERREAIDSSVRYKSDRSIANYRRSMTQKLRCYESGKKKYSDAEIAEILEYKRQRESEEQEKAQFRQSQPSEDQFNWQVSHHKPSEELEFPDALSDENLQRLEQEREQQDKTAEIQCNAFDDFEDDYCRYQDDQYEAMKAAEQSESALTQNDASENTDSADDFNINDFLDIGYEDATEENVNDETNSVEVKKTDSVSHSQDYQRCTPQRKRRGLAFTEAEAIEANQNVDDEEDKEIRIYG